MQVLIIKVAISVSKRVHLYSQSLKWMKKKYHKSIGMISIWVGLAGWYAKLPSTQWARQHHAPSTHLSVQENPLSTLWLLGITVSMVTKKSCSFYFLDGEVTIWKIIEKYHKKLNIYVFFKFFRYIFIDVYKTY